MPCHTVCARLSSTWVSYISETDSEVTLEFELPFWIEEEDVQVDIGSTKLSVFVRNELSFRRRYRRNRFATFPSVLQSSKRSCIAQWCMQGRS